MEGSIRSSGCAEVVSEQPPLAYPATLRALAGCSADTARLLRQRRVHLPKDRVGMRLRFADGTSARVFRETTVDRGATLDPCVLVVEFRLRAVRGRGHAVFRRESLLNTPLFAGFPGLVSKLWLADDERGRYRGCMSGIARGSRKTTPGPCGGCSRWCRCGARSTTSCCPRCAAATCWPSRRNCPAPRPGGGT